MSFYRMRTVGTFRCEVAKPSVHIHLLVIWSHRAKRCEREFRHGLKHAPGDCSCGVSFVLLSLDRILVFSLGRIVIQTRRNVLDVTHELVTLFLEMSTVDVIFPEQPAHSKRR